MYMKPEPGERVPPSPRKKRKGTLEKKADGGAVGTAAVLFKENVPESTVDIRREDDKADSPFSRIFTNTVTVEDLPDKGEWYGL